MTTQLPPVDGKFSSTRLAGESTTRRPVNAPQESFEELWAGLIDEQGYPAEICGQPEEREWR